MGKSCIATCDFSEIDKEKSQHIISGSLDLNIKTKSQF